MTPQTIVATTSPASTSTVPQSTGGSATTTTIQWAGSATTPTVATPAVLGAATSSATTLPTETIATTTPAAATTTQLDTVATTSPGVVPQLVAATSSATSTGETTGVLSEFNKLGISGSCVVTRATNQKQCDIQVTYRSAAGALVVGVPVKIATMNGEGAFTNVDGPLLISNKPGVVVQSGTLANNLADVATYLGNADATSATLPMDAEAINN
jgi:hypothetical protein